MRVSNEATKEKFILAAIAEMEKHGTTDFSIRRVAAACGVSCGAPYKHFKSKSDLILEVLRYIHKQWLAVLKEATSACENGTLREKLLAVSLAYVRFLIDHPDYQTILMMNDHSMTPEQLREKAEISPLSQDLIRAYCASVDMADAVRERKFYAVMSFIYGAAITVNSHTTALSDAFLENVRYCIDREFDLP